MVIHGKVAEMAPVSFLSFVQEEVPEDSGNVQVASPGTIGDCM